MRRAPNEEAARDPRAVSLSDPLRHVEEQFRRLFEQRESARPVVVRPPRPKASSEAQAQAREQDELPGKK